MLSLFIADFGIGGLAAGQALREEARRPTVHRPTMPSVARGAFTPLYASREQAMGGPPDPRDDVHALGVIWYQLITRDLGMTTIPSDWREIVEERGLNEEQVRLLASSMASRAERRPVSATQMMQHLARLYEWALDDITNKIHLPEWTVEVSIPGKWSSRPADDPEAEWSVVCDTPAAGFHS